MIDDLRARLESFLAALDSEAIINGLEPIGQRLQRQFGQASSPQFGEKLYHFCTAYISMVPKQIELLQAASVELKLVELVNSYSSLASKFLASACDEIEHQNDALDMEHFLILLQGAYVYGRMQEELDDKIQAFVGAPFGHLNLMEANLIVHEVLGDAFANRLDKVVVSLIQQAKVSMNVIEANLDPKLIETAKASNQSLTGKEIESLSAQHGLSMLNALL